MEVKPVLVDMEIAYINYLRLNIKMKKNYNNIAKKVIDLQINALKKSKKFNW